MVKIYKATKSGNIEPRHGFTQPKIKQSKMTHFQRGVEMERK